MRRISIRSLMAVVLISAVGLAALRTASDLWAGWVLLLALAGVGIAVLGAVFMRGPERAWWVGFALFSGAYLALAVGPWFRDRSQPQLGTTYLLDYVHGRIHASPKDTPVDFEELKAQREKAALALASIRSIVRNLNDPAFRLARQRLDDLDVEISSLKRMATLSQFHTIGHSVFCLLAGLAGGMVAVWFDRRRERGEVLSG